MKNRTPAIPNGGKPIAFSPVPRKHRHDGWTPERQRAFIDALADTGSVSRAAAMVNMSSVGAYYLRRQPAAEDFAAAWSAALDHGVLRMKDIAFERAVEGELVPILAGGKLIGYRRRYNDRLLMFCLRHYGQDAAGKRTTINYFSTRASAGAGAGEAAAEASTTTVRTTITGAPDADAASLATASTLLAQFEGVDLDPQAQAEIARVLDECAARRRVEQGISGKGWTTTTGCLSEQPGRYRVGQNVVVGQHNPPDHSKVEEEMALFFSNLARLWGRFTATEAAAYALWGVNHIHPFMEGNGRSSRAICYFVLCVKLGFWLPGKLTLPEQIRINKRQEYCEILGRLDSDRQPDGMTRLDELTDFLEVLLSEQLKS